MNTKKDPKRIILAYLRNRNDELLRERGRLEYEFWIWSEAAPAAFVGTAAQELAMRKVQSTWNGLSINSAELVEVGDLVADLGFCRLCLGVGEVRAYRANGDSAHSRCPAGCPVR